MRTDAAVGGLVLAAGLGRRWGGAKLAAPFEGRPLLAHVLDAVRFALDEGTLATAVVVIPAGPDAPPEASLLRRLAEERGMSVVVNDDPAAGLARSLRLGLAALEASPVEAGIVLLGDQPRTRLDVIRALVAKWRRSHSPILVPRYGRVPGNPVVVGREVWALARRLRGDSGMRAVARRHPELLADLYVGGANPDVDRPADLEALVRPSA